MEENNIMEKFNYDDFKSVILKSDIEDLEIENVLSPLFGDSFEIAKILNDMLEREFAIDFDESIPKEYDIYTENFYTALKIALDNGLNPNEIIPYDDGEDGGDNLMWSIVGWIRHYDIAPKALKLLLEHGGNPNLKIGTVETVFSEVDNFFWLSGEDLGKNLLRCWLLLAAYGGDRDNINFLPLRMLHNHSVDKLKNYQKYDFAFETVEPNIYKRERVMFIVDKITGEKVAVNETPFG